MLNEEVAKVYDRIHQSSAELTQIWLRDMLFTWRWWLSLAFLVVPWIIWVIVRKKDSTERLLLAGAIVAFLSLFVEQMGASMGLWWYGSKLIPVPTESVPLSISLLPVGTMLMLQYKPETNPWLKAVIFGVGTSFVGLPLIRWLHMYEFKNWNYFYSFIITFVFYLVANYIVTRTNFEPL